MKILDEKYLEFCSKNLENPGILSGQKSGNPVNFLLGLVLVAIKEYLGCYNVSFYICRSSRFCVVSVRRFSDFLWQIVK